MKLKRAPAAAPPAPILEPDYPARLREMGLHVMVFGRYVTPDHSRSESGATFWHPEIIAGADLTLIVWRRQGDPHNAYGFDGYTVQRGSHDFGGTHRTLAEALAWVRWWRERHMQPTTGFDKKLT